MIKSVIGMIGKCVYRGIAKSPPTPPSPPKPDMADCPTTIMLPSFGWVASTIGVLTNPHTGWNLEDHPTFTPASPDVRSLGSPHHRHATSCAIPSSQIPAISHLAVNRMEMGLEGVGVALWHLAAKPSLPGLPGTQEGHGGISQRNGPAEFPL